MLPRCICSARFADEPARYANMGDMTTTLIRNELNLLETLVPLADTRLLEAGCGAAHLARELVVHHGTTEAARIDVDERQ